MKDVSREMDDVYLEYAKELAERGEIAMKLSELDRSIEEKKIFLTSTEGDGSHGVDLSAHAFKQISKRLETLAHENDVIYNDYINLNDSSKSKVFPSNLESFIITLVASAKKKNNFSREQSKNNATGVEYRYNIEIKGWSDSKSTLQFTCIVENNNIKTGYFNWI